jgi:2-oxoglutarate ferredoxin oxidoreductase subunit alpha
MPFAPGENAEAHRISADGNTMLALGLIAGGCRFGAGYPITPWTSIMELLRSELPKYGGMFIRTEDELAAVSLAIGASYAGHLAVTGSSGPGLSLKSEAIAYATMAELPLVVVNILKEVLEDPEGRVSWRLTTSFRSAAAVGWRRGR